MTEQEFELKSDFIPLIGLLKHTGIAATGGHAGMMVTEGEVKVNGKRELQKRKKLKAGDIVTVGDYIIKMTAPAKA
jgi:ribosome-associated protein